MNRVGGLFDRFCSLENLLDAFHKAQKGKSDRREVVRFRSDLNSNLAGIVAKL